MIDAAIDVLLDRFPCVRVGDGPEPIVVFPGFGDAMFSGRYPPGFEWGLYWYFSRYVDDYTVYVLSRPRGLPEGHGVAEMADEYASVLEAEIGLSSVLGFSMGGQIAQELAVRHADLVDALVLTNTGYRVADVADIDRLIEYARERDWARIRAELFAAMFADWRAVTYPPVVLTVGRFVQPRPAVPEDVRISLDAIRAFDGRDVLDRIDTPTLVVGGTADPYFPEHVLEATAAGIPGAELSMIEGGKHGAFHERKPVFDDRARTFLERTASARPVASD